MTEDSSSSERDEELLRLLRDSKAINFEQLGELVSRVTPELLSGKARGADYIISIISSFIKIYILSALRDIGRLPDLRAAGRELKG
mgnify:CR=1 FL=1